MGIKNGDKYTGVKGEQEDLFLNSCNLKILRTQ